MPSTHEVTQVLRELSDGQESAPQRLMPLVYDELRKLAAGYLKGERADHTLQATALVHEAYLRLVDWKNVSWQNRAHFFALAAHAMRGILVDHARARKAEKRGGGMTKLALEEAVSFPRRSEVDLLALDESLRELAEFDPAQSRIVELRFFGGLTIDETAEVMGISPATIKREWKMAKAWLHQRIARDL